MEPVPTALIRNNARCKDCDHRFTAYTFSDFEYGRRLGRTPDPQRLGLLDCFTDIFFQEVGDLVDKFLEPLGKEEWRRSQCLDSVFGIACDAVPSGYQYDFSGRIACPFCGSFKVGYGPDDPPQAEILNLAPVTHDTWQQLTTMEKREQIREALNKARCLSLPAFDIEQTV